ncbi:tRNA (adenosine(37)-N6)-dimethylallyltransferase MiaA [bacterium]|nr:tRNA (adenosine(37)-N6)-dimethylallyltransferase MiaA [bacterium]
MLVLAGPTASGKTVLGVETAERLGGEIISADSRQVYRGLDIGTAKPTPQELARAPHHLIDRVEPTEKYSAGRFAREASAVIEKLAGQGRAPIVCGGTGFYIAALFEPLFEEPEGIDRERQANLRDELKARAGRGGAVSLHAELERVDPASAARLHPNDFQRVSRALELFRLTGRTMTELLVDGAAQTPQRFSPLYVLLDPQPEVLKSRIGRRVELMLEAGWLEEVQGLLQRGVPAEAPGFQSLGYAEMLALARGELSPEVTREAITARTWQYARRQRTWFRRQEAALRLEGGEGLAGAVAAHWRQYIESKDWSLK